MRGHHGFQPLGDQVRERHQIVRLDVHIGARIDRQFMVRIGGYRAVPGEVLAGGSHAGTAHAADIGSGERRHHRRIAVKSAVTDDTADAAVDIEHRRETEVDTHAAQLDRHQPAGGFGQRHRPRRRLIMHAAERGERRQRREPGAQALHPSALLIDGDQQRWIAQGMDFRGERRQLQRRFVIAREQDHTADLRMPQQIAFRSR